MLPTDIKVENKKMAESNWELKYNENLKYFRAKCKRCLTNPVTVSMAGMSTIYSEFYTTLPYNNLMAAVARHIYWRERFFMQDGNFHVKCRACNMRYLFISICLRDPHTLSENDLMIPNIVHNEITPIRNWNRPPQCHICESYKVKVIYILTTLNHHLYMEHRDIWMEQHNANA